MIATKSAREILKATVPLKDMIRQSANLGSFVIGMHNGDLDLISRSMHDYVIEPQRKHLIPYFDELQNTALRLGALGCSISGAGPAVFALCQEKLMASDLVKAMNEIYLRHGLEARTFVGSIHHAGTTAL
jgi:homoserine kinase